MRSALIISLLAHASPSALVHMDGAPSALVDMDLFVGGHGGYTCYRLPNLLQMRAPGHLVAIAQGHKNGCADAGWMDALVRTTRDNGRTWSEQALLYPNTQHRTMGTPTAVVDLSTDTIFLFLCVDFEQVLLLNSTDGGLSWSAPRNMTHALVPPSWGRVYYGTQQGITVQLSNGTQRLILCAPPFPCQY